MQNISHFFFVWILHHQTSQPNLEAGYIDPLHNSKMWHEKPSSVVKGFGHAKSIQLEETVLNNVWNKRKKDKVFEG